jgi:hypothetical protein
MENPSSFEYHLPSILQSTFQRDDALRNVYSPPFSVFKGFSFRSEGNLLAALSAVRHHRCRNVDDCDAISTVVHASKNRLFTSLLELIRS